MCWKCRITGRLPEAESPGYLQHLVRSSSGVVLTWRPPVDSLHRISAGDVAFGGPNQILGGHREDRWWCGELQESSDRKAGNRLNLYRLTDSYRSLIGTGTYLGYNSIKYSIRRNVSVACIVLHGLLMIKGKRVTVNLWDGLFIKIYMVIHHRF